MKRKCDTCGKEYNADKRNLRRGWGLCCSKSCAAKKRETNKPGYNPIRVALNNERRENWVDIDCCGSEMAEYYDGMDFLSECGDR